MVTRLQAEVKTVTKVILRMIAEQKKKNIGEVVDDLVEEVYRDLVRTLVDSTKQKDTGKGR